jgi:hypothetical protein
LRVANDEVGRIRKARRLGKPGELPLAKLVERRRLGSVMAVDIDDHEVILFSLVSKTEAGVPLKRPFG